MKSTDSCPSMVSATAAHPDAHVLHLFPPQHLIPLLSGKTQLTEIQWALS